MPRRATGAIVEHEGKDKRTYRALRFTAYGKRQYTALGPVSREYAERELRGVLADVERGTWQPDTPAPAPGPIAPEVTFHQFAELWWVERERELRDATKADYRWRLENHLLPFFGQHMLRQITIAEVDRYKAVKLREGRLSARSINMTLTLLGAILDVAQERELVDRNTAKQAPPGAGAQADTVVPGHRRPDHRAARRGRRDGRGIAGRSPARSPSRFARGARVRRASHR